MFKLYHNENSKIRGQIDLHEVAHYEPHHHDLRSLEFSYIRLWCLKSYPICCLETTLRKECWHILNIVLYKELSNLLLGDYSEKRVLAYFKHCFI